MSFAEFLSKLTILALPVMAATSVVGAAAAWTAREDGHWYARLLLPVGLVGLSLLVFPPQARSVSLLKQQQS